MLEVWQICCKIISNQVSAVACKIEFAAFKLRKSATASPRLPTPCRIQQEYFLSGPHNQNTFVFTLAV